MSGKTGVGPAKYSTTLDLHSSYFIDQVFFWVFFLVSQVINPLLSDEIYFGLVKVPVYRTYLSSEILSLLGKTVISVMFVDKEGRG